MFSEPKLPCLQPHCQAADHLASSITKSQTFEFLHFWEDETYFYVLKIPCGVLVLLLSGGGGGEQGLAEGKKVSQGP